MEVIRKKNKEDNFENLVSGEVFLWNNRTYIKTNEDNKAVDLEDGYTVNFDDYDVIETPKEAFLTIA